MRQYRLHSLLLGVGLGVRTYGDSHGRGRYAGQRDSPRFGSGNGPSSRDSKRQPLNEPQLVAKLLEYFPADKPALPVNVWARAIPDDIQEALVQYGGLGNFASSQSNFFILRKENGMSVVSLSTMASRLCSERARMEKKREMMGTRGGRGEGRPSFGRGRR